MPWLYAATYIVTAEKHLSCNEAKPSSSRSKSSMPVIIQKFVSSVGISDTKRRGSRHHRDNCQGPTKSANAERKC
jgi:hypothetical protein